MEERDNSYTAIMERYTKANILAITQYDRTTFESLMDIPRLIKRCKDLEGKDVAVNTIIRVQREALLDIATLDPDTCTFSEIAHEASVALEKCEEILEGES